MQRAGALRCGRLLAIAIIGSTGFAVATAEAAEPAPALAADDILHHVSVGYLAHDVSGLWSGFRIERAATAANIDLVFAPHFDLFGGSIRPALGGTIANGDGTSFGYADARYEIAGPFGTFFGLGLGLAIHDGALAPQTPSDGHRLKALGSRALFHVPIEIGVTFAERLRVSAYFEHVSNGWLGTDINEGMDNLGMRIGYKF